MADMVASGVVDLSVFEHCKFKLENMNVALGGIETTIAGSATT